MHCRRLIPKKPKLSVTKSCPRLGCLIQKSDQCGELRLQHKRRPGWHAANVPRAAGDPEVARVAPLTLFVARW
jgi:hypothetical protein